jgi:hypothetical protein
MLLCNSCTYIKRLLLQNIERGDAMYEKNIIVRADYYPNGEIIPLCVTFSNGESFFFDSITNIEKDFETNKVLYYCLYYYLL